MNTDRQFELDDTQESKRTIGYKSPTQFEEVNAAQESQALKAEIRQYQDEVNFYRNVAIVGGVFGTAGCVGGVVGAAALVGALNLSQDNAANIAAVQRQIADLRTTATATPSLTPSTTATVDSWKTAQANVANDIALDKTLTKIAEAPTATPTQPTANTEVPATAVPEEPKNMFMDGNIVYPGEFLFNNLRAHYEGDDLMNVIKTTFMDTLAYSTNNPDYTLDEAKLADSTLSSLVNPLGKPWNTNPLKEGGLSQTHSDIRAYRNILDIMNSPVAVDAIAHINENGVITAGVYGPANDTDVMVAYLATAHAYVKKPKAFKDVVTARGALSNRQTANVIAPYQNQMFGKIQKQFFGLSKEEGNRRNNNDKNDMSNELNPSLKKPDQWLSCDVYRVMTDAEKQTRDEQMQKLRLVTHKSQDLYTFTKANSEAETVLLVWAYDTTTNQWDIKRFTFRGYNGYIGTNDPVVPGQIDSAVGEQTLPCGVGAPAVPTPGQAGPQVHEGTPHETPVVTPGDTPEVTRTVPATVTLSPGQTPVATATGIGPTPIAPTPVPTAKPTEQVPPTVPPAAPSSTPSF